MSSPAPASSFSSLGAVSRQNPLLVIGGYFSLAFAVFQLSGIWWPVSAIRYFGGPVQLREERPLAYGLLCLVVSVIVAVFGLYALSGAGKIRRLPLLRTALTVATSIYLLRGLLIIPQIPFVLKHPDLVLFLIFSLISLCVGIIHLGGLVRLFRLGAPAR